MEGLDLLKSVSKPEWLKQPDQDLSIFAEHPCKDAWYDVWKNPSYQGLWQYDKHAAYLACASSVKLGVGEYVQLDNVPSGRLGPSFPTGLFLVDMPKQDTQTFPFLFSVGPQWLYTPLLALAHEADLVFTIREAYIWPEQHYVFRSFYEHLKARREAGENVKHLYTQAFGMLAHKPSHLWKSCLYRPDWYSLLIAECKARMYRHAWQVHELEEVWPVAIKNVDSLYYDRQVHSLRLGEGIGAFREIKL